MSASLRCGDFATRCRANSTRLALGAVAASALLVTIVAAILAPLPGGAGLSDEDDLAFVPWVLDGLCSTRPEILLRTGTWMEPVSVVVFALILYVAVLVKPLAVRVIGAVAETARKAIAPLAERVSCAVKKACGCRCCYAGVSPKEDEGGAPPWAEADDQASMFFCAPGDEPDIEASEKAQQRRQIIDGVVALCRQLNGHKQSLEEVIATLAREIVDDTAGSSVDDADDTDLQGAAVEKAEDTIEEAEGTATSAVDQIADNADTRSEEEKKLASRLPPAILTLIFLTQIALCYWILYDLMVNVGDGLEGGYLCQSAFVASAILYKPFGPVMWAVLMTVCSQAYFEHTAWETPPKKQPKGSSCLFAEGGSESGGEMSVRVCRLG